MSSFVEKMNVQLVNPTKLQPSEHYTVEQPGTDRTGGHFPTLAKPHHATCHSLWFFKGDSMALFAGKITHSQRKTRSRHDETVIIILHAQAFNFVLSFTLFWRGVCCESLTVDHPPRANFSQGFSAAKRKVQVPGFAQNEKCICIRHLSSSRFHLVK